MVERVRQNIGAIIQIGTLIFAFAVFYSQAKETGKRVDDHEARMRCIEKTIYEMAADLKVLARAVQK